MDKHNIFFTRTTYNLVRADYAVIMLALIALVLMHWQEVRWGWFVAAFLLSDLIGTFPGMYWYYRRRGGDRRRIPKLFHVLYNTAHSFTVIGAVIALWYWYAGGWEWAMLAMPIHLCGDRSVFGNIYKPFGLSFEPVMHPQFERFQRSFKASGRW